MKNKKIGSLADALSHILSDLNPSHEYWFRGQSKTSFDLIPTVFRKTDTGQHYDEEKLIREFIRNHPEAKVQHSSTIELLTYAQHYGLPTRLLDWTKNLLVALYFCCDENPDDNGNIYSLRVDRGNSHNINFYEQLATSSAMSDVCQEIVRYLRSVIKNNQTVSKHPITLNNKILDYYSNESSFELFCSLREMFDNNEKFSIQAAVNYNPLLYGVLTYNPPIINHRLRAQDGCFTIHGGKIIKGRQVVEVLGIKECIKKNEHPPSFLTL